MKAINIHQLIKELQTQADNGAKNALIKGTLLTDNGNTVILTTEKQF
jgi:hypothetical protein